MILVVATHAKYAETFIRDLADAKPRLKLGRYTGWKYISTSQQLIHSMVGSTTKNPIEVVILRTPNNFWKGSEAHPDKGVFDLNVKQRRVLNKSEEYLKAVRFFK